MVFLIWITQSTNKKQNKTDNRNHGYKSFGNGREPKELLEGEGRERDTERVKMSHGPTFTHNECKQCMVQT